MERNATSLSVNKFSYRRLRPLFSYTRSRDPISATEKTEGEGVLPAPQATSCWAVLKSGTGTLGCGPEDASSERWDLGTRDVGRGDSNYGRFVQSQSCFFLKKKRVRAIVNSKSGRDIGDVNKTFARLVYFFLIISFCYSSEKHNLDNKSLIRCLGVHYHCILLGLEQTSNLSRT